MQTVFLLLSAIYRTFSTRSCSDALILPNISSTLRKLSGVRMHLTAFSQKADRGMLTVPELTWTKLFQQSFHQAESLFLPIRCLSTFRGARQSLSSRKYVLTESKAPKHIIREPAKAKLSVSKLWGAVSVTL